jgi:hypothetical protein
MKRTGIWASYEGKRDAFKGVVRHDGRVIWECPHVHRFARSTYFNRGDVSAQTCANNNLASVIQSRSDAA